MVEATQSLRVVYEAIESELEYQRGKWGGSNSSNAPGDGSRTLDEYALYIEQYSLDLAKVAGHEGDPTPKLEYIRKVAALCVSAMLEHGSIPRRRDNGIPGNK